MVHAMAKDRGRLARVAWFLAVIAVFAGGACGPRSGASLTLIENCAACPSNASGTITVLPGSMPASVQVAALSVRQASSTGDLTPLA